MDTKSDLAKSCYKAIATDLTPSILKYHCAMFNLYDRRLGQGRLFQDRLEKCINERSFAHDLEGACPHFDKYSQTVCTSLVEKMAQVVGGKVIEVPHASYSDLVHGVFCQMSRLVYKDPSLLTVVDSRLQGKYYRMVMDAIERYYLDLVIKNESSWIKKEELPVPKSPSPPPVPLSPSPVRFHSPILSPSKSPLLSPSSEPRPSMQINLIDDIEEFRGHTPSDETEEENGTSSYRESKLLHTLPTMYHFNLPSEKSKSKPRKKNTKKK